MGYYHYYLMVDNASVNVRDEDLGSKMINTPRRPRTPRGNMLIRPDGIKYQDRVFSESTSCRVLHRYIASQTSNKAWLETVDIIVNVSDGNRTMQIVRWRARNQKPPDTIKYWGFVRSFNVRSWPQWYAVTRGVEKWLDRVETLDDNNQPKIEISKMDLMKLTKEKDILKAKIEEDRELQELQRIQLNHVKERMRQMRQHLGFYRKIVRELHRLVTDPATTETRIHEFIGDSEIPWLFGLEYVSIKSKVRFPPQNNKFEFDLMLQRYDGFNDLVELKGPNEQLFVQKTDRRTAFSQKLSEALGQSMIYLTECDKSDELNIFRPRAIIIIGNKTTDDERQRRMVTSHFARIEIITYSDLIERTEQLLLHLKGKAKKRTKNR